MRWFLQRILARLFLKSTIHVASELEAQMAMELGESRAALLRRAHELEQERVPGLEEVATGLRAQAAKMGGSETPASDAARIADLLRVADLRAVGQQPGTLGHERGDIAPEAARALPSPATKNRGRPRKSVEIRTDQNVADKETP